MPSELPLVLEPVDGESGPGYCLRAVGSNRLTLHWLRRSAGMVYGRPMDARFALELSWILGCKHDWLANALPERGAIRGGDHVRYGGHMFLFRNQLRLRHPQICPQCVHHENLCRISWDLSLVTCCLHHGCTLVDACSHCRAPLRWDRPSIGVCNCGRPFAAKASSLPASKAALLAAALLEGCLEEGLNRAGALGFGLPSWLLALGLSGLLCVLQAFGSRTKALEPCSPAIMTRARPTAYWAEVVARAVERLQAIQEESIETLQQLEPVISKALLQQLAFRSPAAYDRQVGAYLLSRLYGERLDGCLDGKFPQYSQIDLFGWPYAQ